MRRNSNDSSESIPRNRRAFWLFKRTYDIILSAAALVVFSPLMLLIAAAIFIDDPQGNPFYKQIRCGRHGKEFVFYKFRTMCVGADKMLDSLLDKNEMTGPAFKMREDPRITRVGKFLRKTCLDELPQFYNVLRGDMSIVGPRPPLPREVAQYTEYDWQRLYITPGLTCIWQVTANRNNTTFQEWVEMDLDYMRARTLSLDFRLMARTAMAMVYKFGL